MMAPPPPFANPVIIWHATVGAGDYLWVPSGIIIREVVNDEMDVAGLRYSLVPTTDVAGGTAFKTMAALPSTPASHVSKTIADLIGRHAKKPE